jgi:hypothetical protein
LDRRLGGFCLGLYSGLFTSLFTSLWPRLWLLRTFSSSIELLKDILLLLQQGFQL